MSLAMLPTPTPPTHAPPSLPPLLIPPPLLEVHNPKLRQRADDPCTVVGLPRDAVTPQAQRAHGAYVNSNVNRVNNNVNRTAAQHWMHGVSRQHGRGLAAARKREARKHTI